MTEPLTRVLFWEDAAARAVAEALRRDGFEAELRRERFAGEDDDEDQPWLVVTDAPAVMAEILADHHDGWVDPDEPAVRDRPAPVEPLGLPNGPRRVRGGGGDN